MGVAVFSIGILATIAGTVYLVRKYGSPKLSYGVQFLVMFTWFLAFSILVILPLDISATVYINCIKVWYCQLPNVTAQNLEGCSPTEDLLIPHLPNICNSFGNCTCEAPYSFVDDSLLRNFWNVVFWSSQALTWVIIPLTEAYFSAGDFSFGQKMKTSLRENAIVYGSALVIFFIVLVYISVKEHLGKDGLKTVIVMTSNTWGLLALICLLGYGIVDYPRSMWLKANPEQHLRYLYFRAATLSAEMEDAEHNEEEVNAEVKNVAGVVKQGDPLRKYVNIVLLRANLDPGAADYEDYRAGGAKETELTRASLAKLHAKVKASKRVLNRCQCQWDDLVQHAVDVQDNIANRHRDDRVFHRSLGGPPKRPHAEWMWRVKIKPGLMYLASFVCVGASIILLWSELSFSKTEPTLSVYALLIDSAADQQNYASLEFLSFITLLYLCLCTYTVIFRIRLFDFFYLVPNRQTDSRSMLFGAMILSRLTPAICLNFIAMAHLDNHVNHITLEQDLYFTQIMGHMDLFNAINTYIPIIMLIIALAAFFSVGSRILTMFGVSRYVPDDPDTEENVAEGKILIRRDIRRRERGEGVAMRNMASTRRRLKNEADDDDGVIDVRGTTTSELSKAERGDDDGGWGSTTKKASRGWSDENDLDFEDFDPSSNNISDGMSFQKGGKKKRDKSGARKTYGRVGAGADDDEALVGRGAGSRRGKPNKSALFDDL